MNLGAASLKPIWTKTLLGKIPSRKKSTYPTMREIVIGQTHHISSNQMLDDVLRRAINEPKKLDTRAC